MGLNRVKWNDYEYDEYESRPVSGIIMYRVHRTRQCQSV